MFDHVCLLSKSSAADLTDEGFLSGVDLQVLLEVESFRIDKKTTDWTAFVVRPVIIHVDVEVVQARQDCVTLDTVHRPQVVLDLVLVLAHGGVVVVVPAGLRLSRRQGGLGDHGGLGEVVQGQLGVLPLLLLGTEPGRQDGGHLRLLLLDEPAEREWQTEVREGCRVVESGVEGLELHGVSRLRPFALLGQVFSPAGNDGVSQLLRHHSSLLTIC